MIVSFSRESNSLDGAILADGQDKGWRILVVKTMTSTIQCGHCAKSKYQVVAEGSTRLYCHGLYFWHFLPPPPSPPLLPVKGPNSDGTSLPNPVINEPSKNRQWPCPIPMFICWKVKWFDVKRFVQKSKMWCTCSIYVDGRSYHDHNDYRWCAGPSSCKSL